MANPNGRPSKLKQVIGTETDRQGNPLTIAGSIIRDLEVGAYIRDASARAGVHFSTVHRWIAQGEEWADSPMEEVPPNMREYREFHDAVERARAGAVMASIAVIRRAAQGTPAEYDAQGNELRREKRPEWQAAAWYLERTRPQDFGRKDRHEVTGKDGATLTLTDLEAAVDADRSD